MLRCFVHYPEQVRDNYRVFVAADPRTADTLECFMRRVNQAVPSHSADDAMEEVLREVAIRKGLSLPRLKGHLPNFDGAFYLGDAQDRFDVRAEDCDVDELLTVCERATAEWAEAQRMANPELDEELEGELHDDAELSPEFGAEIEDELDFDELLAEPIAA